MDLAIRLASRADEIPLRRLVFKYLQETYNQGGDFPATLENAAVFTELAIQGAEEYDPCLVVTDAGKLVGFAMARGTDIPGTTTRQRTVRTWGTYLRPDYRRLELGFAMWLVIGRVARQAGYTRFMAFQFNHEYGILAGKSLARIASLKKAGDIYLWDFGAPPRAVVSEAAEGINA